MTEDEIPEVTKATITEGVDYIKPTDHETKTRIFVDYEEAQEYFDFVRAEDDTLLVNIEDLGAEGLQNLQEPHWFTGELEEDEAPPVFRYAVYLSTEVS